MLEQLCCSEGIVAPGLLRVHGVFCQHCEEGVGEWVAAGFAHWHWQTYATSLLLCGLYVACTVRWSVVPSTL